MPVRLTCQSLENYPAVAKKLLAAYRDRKIFAFSGQLGSGKTTIIQFLCRELGVTDLTVSPSFSIINEYRTADGKKIYHFDFYRINNIKEIFDIGYEEYFYSGDYCFIEWPAKARELLPSNCVYIRIEDPVDVNNRTFVFDTNPYPEKDFI